MTDWDIFPFEAEGLTVRPLAAPVLPESPRAGAGGVDCRSCQDDRGTVWRDERWRLRRFDKPGGAPLSLLLVSRAHVDFTDLPDDRASELGVLLVHVARAIEALPHIARAHVSKWGDGAEHLHLFFYARPAGMRQMLGAFMQLWDDLLPPVPVAERDADAWAVARTLRAPYGGEVVGPL